jgi:hypothetical protein
MTKGYVLSEVEMKIVSFLHDCGTFAVFALLLTDSHP